MKPYHRLGHLVGRFFGAVGARVDPGELGVLDRYLGPAERALFLTMGIADQRHSLDLCRRLRCDGHADPDLLRAALLHDVGKSVGPLPVPYRVIYALCRLVNPKLARWLGQRERPTLVRPFYFAAHHAGLGALAAERAGSNPRVIQLIERHEAPNDQLSFLLYRYDGEM
ncbi:MAG: hypothetical protein ACRDIY_12950 [Chloroflexota bacterium]